MAVHAGSLIGSLKEACCFCSIRPHSTLGGRTGKVDLSGVAASGENVVGSPSPLPFPSPSQGRGNGGWARGGCRRRSSRPAAFLDAESPSGVDVGTPPPPAPFHAEPPASCYRPYFLRGGVSRVHFYACQRGLQGGDEQIISPLSNVFAAR